MLIGRVVVSIVAVEAGADSFTGDPVSPSSPRGGGVFDFSRVTTARVGCGLGVVNTTGHADTKEVMDTVWLLDSGSRLA